MNRVRDLVREMCEKTNITLKLIDGNNREIFNNILSEESQVVETININNDSWKIFVTHSNKSLLPIISFTLDKIIKKENKIELLLEGKKSWSNFEESPLYKKGKIILIECTDIEEVINIVKDTYCGQDVYIEEVLNRIIIIGNLEDEKEHGFSLRETILQNVGNRVYIAIDNFDGTYDGFINCYNDVNEAINIGKALDVIPEIYIVKEMLLEKAIYNLKDSYSEKLQNIYGDMFNKLGNELILTLVEILNCNLSLSKAAKNLFIHRNTLMYRIDKIKKETGLDIRDFKEASYLYILYVNNKRAHN